MTNRQPTANSHPRYTALVVLSVSRAPLAVDRPIARRLGDGYQRDRGYMCEPGILLMRRIKVKWLALVFRHNAAPKSSDIVAAVLDGGSCDAEGI